MNFKTITILTSSLFMFAALAEEHNKKDDHAGHDHDKAKEEHKKVDDHKKEDDHSGHDHDKVKEDHKKEDDHSGHDHKKEQKGHKDEDDHKKEDDHSGHDHEKADKDNHEDEKSGALILTPGQKKAIKLKISTATSGDLKTKIFLRAKSNTTGTAWLKLCLACRDSLSRFSKRRRQGDQRERFGGTAKS